MRDLSRAVIARDAAARIEEAACRGQGERWNELEAAHESTKSAAGSTRIVQTVQREFCAGCPAATVCRQWAETERYDGLAAGAAYSNGQRMSEDWVSGRPGRRPREDARLAS